MYYKKVTSDSEKDSPQSMTDAETWTCHSGKADLLIPLK